MPICASCGLEVARCGFTKAQLGKKDSRRCKQCLTTPDAPGTALVPHSSESTEPVEDLEAALRELETHCALCAAPPPDGGHPWNRCGRCGVPSYCSRECQRMAWKWCELVGVRANPSPDANPSPSANRNQVRASAKLRTGLAAEDRAVARRPRRAAAAHDERAGRRRRGRGRASALRRAGGALQPRRAARPPARVARLRAHRAAG